MSDPNEPVYVGPDRFGRVTIRHPEAGEAKVPPVNVAYYEARGWEVVEDEPEEVPQPKKPARPAKPKE
jgi:hypothetical protein